MNRPDSQYFRTAVKMDQALMALLEEKPFQYITVSELCKRAGVNRSTFYLHYETICDLLEETSRYLIDDFLSYFPVDTDRIAARFTDCDAEALIFISQEYLYPYLTYVRENARVFSTAVAHAKPFAFDRIFQRLFQHVFDPIMERFHYPPAHREYVILFYLNGIHAVICQWLKDDCRKPVEEMAQIFQECVFGLPRL